MKHSYKFIVELGQPGAASTVTLNQSGPILLGVNIDLNAEQCPRSREDIAQVMNQIIDDLQASYREFLNDPLFARKESDGS